MDFRSEWEGEGSLKETLGVYLFSDGLRILQRKQIGAWRGKQGSDEGKYWRLLAVSSAYLCYKSYTTYLIRDADEMVPTDPS